MLSSKLSKMQGLSYTNKDFESIYPELLDLVKVLTYKWDPSISNESDPGVILLKLNAIIADKCNYNSDKNVLECFPLSVTQDQNARQLFAQLGYYMHWYRSASTDVTLKWSQDTVDYSFNIPAFTMVSDTDKSVVYSLIGPTLGTSNTLFNVGDQTLPCDGTAVTFKAIQGIAVDYSINGEKLITANYLDDQNRLYFDTLDIAENGIFITNADTKNYSSWIRKDNLIAESLNNTFYRFGVSDDGSSCYIEFPQDVETIFRNGIYITYIRTSGSEGNISAKTLQVFYNDIAVKNADGESMTLNSENVYITNAASAKNGQDVQSIDDAYREYQRVSGTFNTLVTLRDYINYILRSGLVSNGFVCDRTNDIQSVYKVMTSVNDLSQATTYIEKQGTSPVLTAFSLKLYLLQYLEDISDYQAFDKTFMMMTDEQLANVKSYVTDVKSIQHDYTSLLPKTSSRSNICYFKNKYPVTCKIIPQYSLNAVETQEVKTAIKQALYNAVNAKEVNFGEEIPFEVVYDAILNADKRIKTVSLDNIDYTTYAVYFDGKSFNEVDITHTDHMVNITSPDNLKVSVLRGVFESKIGVGNYSPQTFVFSNSSWTRNGEDINLSDYGITIVGTPVEDDTVIIEPSIAAQLREEIYIKSVLAGVTQFFVKDELFDYGFEQSYTTGGDNKAILHDDIESVSSNVNIVLNNNTSQYTLRDNETIQLYCPNLTDSSVYSNYVKYEYFIHNNVSANQSVQLSADEYIIFYWKDSDDEAAMYKYAIYGEGNVICPTFSLPGKTTEVGIIGASLKDNFINKGTVVNPILVASSDISGDMTYTMSTAIQSLGADYILSGTNKIATKLVNRISLDQSYNCYWILNNSVNDKYTLFTKGTTVKTYMLNVGEYFIYTDAATTDLVILGAGTQITISDTSIDYVVNAVNASKVLENGTDALKGYWFNLPKNSTFTVTETYYLNISPGSVIKLTPTTTYSSWSVTFDHEGVSFTGGPTRLSSFIIQYKKYASDADWITVDQLELNGYSGWEGRSLLGLNMSADTEQILLANQSITYYTHEGTSTTINGSDLYDRKYAVCLKSEHPLSLNGAEQIVVTWIEDESVKYQRIYQYGKYVSKKFDDVEYSSSGDVNITFPGSTSVVTKYLDFYVPDGDYIVGLYNAYTSIETSEMLLDGVKLSYIYDKTKTSFNDKGMYYFYMHIDNSQALPEGQNEHRLTLSVKTTAGTDVIIVLNNLYRYTYPELLNNYSDAPTEPLQIFKNLQVLLSQFDPDNLYDYTYQVDNDVAISDPLDPNEFLNVNHIYNPYVICEMLPVYDSDIGVIGKR